jgi:hypothetical protein
MRSSPRSCCPGKAATRARSGSTPPCSTPSCTPPASPTARPGRKRSPGRCCCRSRGPGCPCTRPGRRRCGPGCAAPPAAGRCRPPTPPAHRSSPCSRWRCARSGPRTCRPAAALRDALFTTTWVPVPAAPAAEPEPAQAVIVGEAVLAAPGTPGYPDLAALAAAVAAGQPAPQTVLACVQAGHSLDGGHGNSDGAIAGNSGGAAAADGAGGQAAAARAVTGRVLGLVQDFLGRPELAASRLAVVTRGAVAASRARGWPTWPPRRPGAWSAARRARTPAAWCWPTCPPQPGRGSATRAAPCRRACPLSALARRWCRRVLARTRRRCWRWRWPRGSRRSRSATAACWPAAGPPGRGAAVPGGGVPWRLAVTEQGTLEGWRCGGGCGVVAGSGAGRGAGGRGELPRRGGRARDVPDGKVLGGEAAGVVLEDGSWGDRVCGG